MFADAASEMFVDLVVSRHWLANFCRRIVIPIVLPAMPNHDAAFAFDSAD
jgi:hypothetical protein